MSDGGGRTSRTLRAYFMEIAVIVFSILMAFGLDRGYDNLKDRREERVALRGLLDDFRKNRGEVDSQLEQISLGSASFTNILESLADPDLSQDTLPWRVVRNLFLGGSLDTYTATLDHLGSSGRMDLIRDGQLRTLLAEWRGEVQDARDQQVRMVELKGAHLWPLLAEAGFAVPEGMVPGFDPPPARAQVPLAQALPSRYADAVLRQIAFRNFVAGLDMEVVRDATDAVIARLELLLAP